MTEVGMRPSGPPSTRPTIPISEICTKAVDATVLLSYSIQPIDSHLGPDYPPINSVVIVPRMLPAKSLPTRRVYYKNTSNQAAEQASKFAYYMNDDDIDGPHNSPTSGIILHMAATILDEETQLGIAGLHIPENPEDLEVPAVIDEKLKSFLRAAGSTVYSHHALSAGKEDDFPRVCVLSPSEWRNLVDSTPVSEALPSLRNVEMASAAKMTTVYRSLRGNIPLYRPQKVEVCWQQADGTLCRFTGLTDGSDRIRDLIHWSQLSRANRSIYAAVPGVGNPYSESLPGGATVGGGHYGQYGGTQAGSSVPYGYEVPGQVPPGWIGAMPAGQDGPSVVSSMMPTYSGLEGEGTYVPGGNPGYGEPSGSTNPSGQYPGWAMRSGWSGSGSKSRE